MPKKVVKKPARKTAAKKTPKPIGQITHFYGHIKVAVAKFSKPLKVGAEVRVKGATTDFKQVIASAQYEHEPLKIIPKGKLIGFKVNSRVRQGDKVYLDK